MGPIQDVSIENFSADQMGYRFGIGRLVVIARGPNDFHAIRKRVDDRQDFPMIFLEPTEIPRIEHIAVDGIDSHGQKIVFDLVQADQNYLAWQTSLPRCKSEMTIASYMSGILMD